MDISKDRVAALFVALLEDPTQATLPALVQADLPRLLGKKVPPELGYYDTQDRTLRLTQVPGLGSKILLLLADQGLLTQDHFIWEEVQTQENFTPTHRILAGWRHHLHFLRSGHWEARALTETLDTDPHVALGMSLDTLTRLPHATEQPHWIRNFIFQVDPTTSEILLTLLHDHDDQGNVLHRDDAHALHQMARHLVGNVPSAEIV